MAQQYSHIVLGLGATGLSVVRYLCEQGITPLVMDSRMNPPGADKLAAAYPSVELIAGGFDCRYLVQASQIVISPGISVETPEVRAAFDMGIEVIGDIELFARALANSPASVIAITGSNGKSTVTTLVGEMAAAAGRSYAMGGNIGIPVLDLLLEPKELYVLELSSFQLETTHSLNCIAATCLNISADHMDRYSDLESYRQAKLNLYDQSKSVLFNREDQLTLPNSPMNQNSFGLDAPEVDAWGVVEGQIVHGSSQIMAISDVALVGSHNHANLIAAMALATAAGIERQYLVEVAQQFNGLTHRCEVVADIAGVTYVNDSKATNVGATVAAIDGLSEHLGELILIAGGDGKGADFSALATALGKVSTLITLGQDGGKIAALKEGALAVNTMAEAVALANEVSTAGDIVILSPACASLDMYPNFMVRGDDFRAEVGKLNA
ncbi:MULTISPECIES: UDP-N-acetylmuramoyl-L-alanine--D-glutamate ligase [unclassified Shewanella]|jgi:UDP-N-acetylmuramoylalanine--D-glutamate ligase|uniref:UDP-N-acetylmuramoyl-L-alanine--D-glutamate ligase n=1 Tax=unclassified Shewanella TaxID=196818 RepID=UPI000C7E4611|nr:MULTISPECIES: UDP-N-acetylmuramoyl-L-alanine--D-glutamate ligase [unclassified Shewanella]PKG56795.1 UDP-N-acetylmuramoyl-L-alanine--D-glutamate ligase [Shewanella sp. GutDb-MelDb]PKG75695.1 UDP-N-acetylmuramoyl-L-alanine--D-glutamate ligase [Shewanella sp. GutCb]